MRGRNFLLIYAGKQLILVVVYVRLLHFTTIVHPDVTHSPLCWRHAVYGVILGPLVLYRFP